MFNQVTPALTTFTLEAYTDAKNSFGEDIMTLGFSISGTSRNKTRRSWIRQSLVTPKMAPFPFYTGKGEDVEIVITELTPAGETALVKGPYSGKLTRFESPKIRTYTKEH